MKKFLVETICTYRMRYVVEAEDQSVAETFVLDALKTSDIKEFSQQHISEELFSTRRIKDKEFIKLFDTDNDYLKQWSDKMKYEFINRIQPDKEPTEW